MGLLRVSNQWYLAIILLFGIGWGQPIFGQSTFLQPADTLKKGRLRGIAIGTSVVYGGTLIALNELWYKDYPRTSFHFIKDRDDWLQMDKVGHVLGAYYESVAFARLLNWSGVAQEKQVLYGGMAGFVLQTPIEILDGFSEGWGASPGDIVANTLGSGIFIGQEKAWGEQKIRLKYSFSTTRYSDLRPGLLGENVVQQSLKDYNGQTYWVSIGINDLVPKHAPLPDWLNVASGYGAHGMIGGAANPEAYSDIPRYRQYYLSLDVNTTAIDTRSRAWNTVLHALSFLKFPAPALEYNGEQGLRWHWLHF